MSTKTDTRDPSDRALFTSEDDCPVCSASLGPSTDWVWHYSDEDCRAIRQPDSDKKENHAHLR